MIYYKKNMKFLYIFFIKALMIYSECDIEQPFKRGDFCSSNACTENEENCLIDNSIIKTQWLNNIYIFNEYNYRYGSFALNKNKDMIIEYSFNNKRLFFCLSKSGKYNFTKTIEINDEINYKRLHSRIIFVTDNNNKKQYLFSTGLGESNTELYDLEENRVIYNTTTNFLNKTIYSYVFSLSELSFDDDHKEYLISYLYLSIDEGNDHYRDFVNNKMTFSGFKLNSLESSKDEIIPINLHNRIAISFLMNNKIILFYLTGTLYFRIKILDYNLKNIYDNNTLDIDTFNGDWPWGAVVFLKGLHLKDNIVIFNYYSYQINLKIKVGKINNLSFEEKIVGNINYNNNGICLNHEVLYNDCLKINEERIIFISKSNNNSSELYILLYDLYNDYNNLKIRIYKSIFYKYKIYSELTSIIYNDYLVFSSTMVNSDEDNPNNENCFSIFLIYGYVNGTDKTIDNISEYFRDENDNNNKNIVEELTQNVNIENNIFGYEIVDKIKLISIPDEIIFNNKNNINMILKNNDILDIRYRIFIKRKYK